MIVIEIAGGIILAVFILAFLPLVLRVLLWLLCLSLVAVLCVFAVWLGEVIISDWPFEALVIGGVFLAFFVPWLVYEKSWILVGLSFAFSAAVLLAIIGGVVWFGVQSGEALAMELGIGGVFLAFFVPWLIYEKKARREIEGGPPSDMSKFLAKWYGHECPPWTWPGTFFVVAFALLSAARLMSLTLTTG
jgi:hypothetical protein